MPFSSASEALAAVFLYQGVSWRGNLSVRSLR